MMRPNKLEGLPLETLSSQVLEFEGKARANPNLSDASFLGKLLVLPAKVKTRLESICQAQTLYLIWPHHQQRRNKFHNVDTWSKFSSCVSLKTRGEGISSVDLSLKGSIQSSSLAYIY
jgi:hypothetical protein